MIPLVYYCCRGIGIIFKFLSGKKYGAVKYCIPALYAASFIYFVVIYFESYNKEMADYWKDGLDDALSYADSSEADEIHVVNAYYPNVLFYTQYPADEFLSTVNWADGDSAFRAVGSFGKYYLTDFIYTAPAPNSIYICSTDNEYSMAYLTDNNMQVTMFDSYALGYYQ